MTRGSTPFLLDDRRHVFYVKTAARAVSIAESTWYGVEPELVYVEPYIPEIFYEYQEVPELKLPDPIGPVVQEKKARVFDPAEVRRFVTEDAHIRTALADRHPVQFGETTFGMTGPVAEGPMGRQR